MSDNTKYSIHKIDPHRYDTDIVYNPYVFMDYITDHFHTFDIISSSTYEHTHNFKGKTLDKNYKSNTHTHNFRIRIETNNGFHIISGETGPALKTDNGHRHFMNGITSNDKNHIHFFEEYTSDEIK